MASSRGFYVRHGKRAFDFALAAVGLVLGAWLIAAVAAAVWIFSDRPILFRQERVGLNGRTFRVYKFRTMSQTDRPGGVVTVAGDRRITPIGRFLRRWKLDELPQLYNVLRGDMSFVGPRPDVPGYADALEGDARKILSVRPGITGPATLAFRHEEELLNRVPDPVWYNDHVVFPEKVRLNLIYVEECSFLADLRYIARTLGVP